MPSQQPAIFYRTINYLRTAQKGEVQGSKVAIALDDISLAYGSLSQRIDGLQAVVAPQASMALASRAATQVPALFGDIGGSLSPGQLPAVGVFHLIAIGIAALPPAPFTVNENTVAPPIPVTGALVQLAQANSVPCVLEADSFGAVNDGPVYMGRHCEGTAASPSATDSGDALVSVVGRGYGATGWGAVDNGISVLAAENWTDYVQGTFLEFYNTVPTQASQNILGAWVSLSTTTKSALGIGTDSPLQMLHVDNPFGPAYARIQGAISDTDNFAGVEVKGVPSGTSMTGQFVLNSSGELEITFNNGGGWDHLIKMTMATSSSPSSDSMNIILTPGSSGYAILNGNAEHFGADFWGTAVGSEAFRLTNSGYMSWGAGNGSYDISLYRLSSGELYIPGTLKVIDLLVTDSLTLTNPLAVSNGGTGANSAAGALANLGTAAASGIASGSVTLARLTLGGTTGSISWLAGGAISSVISPT